MKQYTVKNRGTGRRDYWSGANWQQPEYHAPPCDMERGEDEQTYLFYNTKSKQVLTRTLGWMPADRIVESKVLGSRLCTSKLADIVKWFPTTQFTRLDRFRAAHPTTVLSASAASRFVLIEDELRARHLPPALTRLPAAKREIDIFQSIIQNGMEGVKDELPQWEDDDNYSIVCKLFGLAEYSRKGGAMLEGSNANCAVVRAASEADTSIGTIDVEENDVPIKSGERISVQISEGVLDEAMSAMPVPSSNGRMLVISNNVGQPATQSTLTASMIACVDGIFSLLSNIEQLEAQTRCELREMEALQQDLLHLVEFANLNAADTYNVCKRLQEVRTRRRAAKDDLYAIGLLRKLAEHTDLQTLDTVSHHLHGMDYRLYTARVMNEEDLDNLITSSTSREKVLANRGKRGVST